MIVHVQNSETNTKKCNIFVTQILRGFEDTLSVGSIPFWFDFKYAYLPVPKITLFPF